MSSPPAPPEPASAHVFSRRRAIRFSSPRVLRYREAIVLRLWSSDALLMLDRLLVEPLPTFVMDDKVPELPFSFVSSIPVPFPSTKGGRFSSLEVAVPFVMPLAVPLVVMLELKWP